MNLLRNRYPNKFEVYLITDLSDKPLYAGQGRCGFRAKNWLRPSRYKKFGQPVKIKYLVIVETRAEALDLEEKFIERFNPPFNICKRGTRHLMSEKAKEKISLAQIKYAKENPGMRSGWQLSDDTKLRMSIAKKGITRSEKVKKKISKSLTGRIISEEHKNNMSKGAKRRWSKK